MISKTPIHISSPYLGTFSCQPCPVVRLVDKPIKYDMPFSDGLFEMAHADPNKTIKIGIGLMLGGAVTGGIPSIFLNGIGLPLIYAGILGKWGIKIPPADQSKDFI